MLSAAYLIKTGQEKPEEIPNSLIFRYLEKLNQAENGTKTVKKRVNFGSKTVKKQSTFGQLPEKTEPFMNQLKAGSKIEPAPKLHQCSD